jgi:hypothetical protein
MSLRATTWRDMASMFASLPSKRKKIRALDFNVMARAKVFPHQTVMVMI